jgi:hypothetical protein
MLGITVPAIHRTVLSGFERNFTLLFAVRADGFMHLSRTSVVSSFLEIHVLFLHTIGIDFSIRLRDYLLPIFWLERKRSLPGTGASILFVWPMLIKVALDRVPFSGAVRVFSLAVAPGMVEGTERFRKGFFSKWPVRGSFPG